MQNKFVSKRDTERKTQHVPSKPTGLDVDLAKDVLIEKGVPNFLQPASVSQLSATPIIQCQQMEEEESLIQAKFKNTNIAPQTRNIGKAAENRTRMPSAIKKRMETLSGVNLSGVTIHTNSSEPARIDALAFTQGQDIYIGPGQGEQLAHECWHAVQQIQGRVKPTTHRNGNSINDDRLLEQEADVMSTKALKQNGTGRLAELLSTWSNGVGSPGTLKIVQRRGITEEYESTARWKHLEGGESREATAAELKNNTFIELHPGDIPKKQGLPKPLPVGVIRFFIDATKRHFREETALSVWKGRDYVNMVVGPEVDKLFSWRHNQSTVAGMIGTVGATLTGLQKNGILDEQFDIKNYAQLQTMLARLSEAGRTQEYASDSKDRSKELLVATGRVTQRDLELKKHLLEIEKYGIEVASLRTEVVIAKNDLETFYSKEEANTAAEALASVQAEKAKVEKWTGAILDVASGGLGVWKGIEDRRKDATDEGSITALSSGVGIVKAISGLVVDAVYADQIKNAEDALKIARKRAAASEEKGLVMKIDTLLSRLSSYVKLCKQINEFTMPYVQMRQAAAGAFGTVAAAAIGEMKETSNVPWKNPYGARTRTSKGNIQRLFANVLEYEAISALYKGSAWPEIEGEIPLSGWMRTDRLLRRRVLEPMVLEAAKLRWWKKRMGNIDKLLNVIKTAIVSIAEKTKSID